MLIELAVTSGGVALWRRFKRKKKTSANDKSSVFKGRRLVADLSSALVGDERQALQKSLDPQLDSDVNDADTAQNQRGSRHSLLLSGGALGLAVLGTSSSAFYLLGSAAVIYLGRHVFQIVWKDFRQGHFISVYLVAVILMLGMIATGQLLYAAIDGILSGFLVRLIKKTEDSSQQQLTHVFAEQPKRVWIEQSGVEIQIDFESVRINDIVIVQSGEVIPVDGLITQGSASIDQHVLTGESQPVNRGRGEPVFAATLVLAGRISVRVETAGDATVAANIGHVLNNTKNYKDELMLRGKRVADKMLPFELAISALTFALLGPVAAIAALWSGLGYRMIVLGPISVLNYLQILSRRGILVKDGRVLESLSKIDTVVFDKTGTLTEKQPTLSKVHVLADCDERELLYFAASAEHRQTHPVAKAIIDQAESKGIVLTIPEETSYEVGYGIKVELAQKTIRVGSARFMVSEGLLFPEQGEALQEHAGEQGHSMIFVGVDDVVAGALELQPSIRPEAYGLISALKQRGIRTYIISGDHERSTRAIAKTLGVDHYLAETLPEHKAERVKQLRANGRFVCFIGDGINDAIALKSAHVSISLKGASTAATDTAQIIFMDGTLAPLERLLALTDDFERTMRRNLMISFAPGMVNLGGVYLLHFGVATSMSLFYGGTAVGLANTTLPMIRHHDEVKSIVVDNE